MPTLILILAAGSGAACVGLVGYALLRPAKFFADHPAVRLAHDLKVKAPLSRVALGDDMCVRSGVSVRPGLAGRAAVGDIGGNQPAGGHGQGGPSQEGPPLSAQPDATTAGKPPRT